MLFVHTKSYSEVEGQREMEGNDDEEDEEGIDIDEDDL